MAKSVGNVVDPEEIINGLSVRQTQIHVHSLFCDNASPAQHDNRQTYWQKQSVLTVCLYTPTQFCKNTL